MIIVAYDLKLIWEIKNDIESNYILFQELAPITSKLVPFLTSKTIQKIDIAHPLIKIALRKREF